MAMLMAPLCPAHLHIIALKSSFPSPSPHLALHLHLGLNLRLQLRLHLHLLPLTLANHNLRLVGPSLGASGAAVNRILPLCERLTSVQKHCYSP